MENKVELKDRKRSIDMSKLSPGEADDLSNQLGIKVREICDEAAEKANKILNIYGMKALMQFAVIGINENKTENNLNVKKRKSSKRG